MKVLVIGNKNVNQRVTNSLAGSEIEVTCQSDISEAVNTLKHEKFDLALIDGYMENLESACNRINWLCRTPIALIIKGEENDWDKLRSMDVDGFIPEEARNIELVAYFQSISRRTNQRLDKIKILVVEDDDQIREALKLSFHAYWPESVVSFAVNGQEGVQMAQSGSNDAILLDLILPDISGFDVLTQIRSFSQTPVIMLTADRNQNNIIEAIRLGANDYVLKPFRQSDLISRIRQNASLKAVAG